MGRRGKSRGGAGGGGGGGRKGNNERTARWSDVPSTNANFIAYYKVSPPLRCWSCDREGRAEARGRRVHERHSLGDELGLGTQRLTAYPPIQAQNIVPEAEWDEFLQALHDPLPTTFRITSCREYALSSIASLILS